MYVYTPKKRRASTAFIVAIGLMILSLFTYFGLSFLSERNADAVSAKDFNPGRIIDDEVFYNYDTMSASQIQNFLNSRVPVCYASSGSPACLKNYKQSTPSISASSYCNAISGGTKTAAQIIYTVAKACKINPQVFTVLLEKEQSLVTSTRPHISQYRSATGFACSDTSPCDPRYEGFFYQVYNAGRQFQIYKAFPNSYNYVAGRNNTVYWHPDLSRCGSSQVYIENQATAALYVYTPYRPNSAALNNMYGTGDSCSSYGNRNFWRIFSDWFGSTRGTPFFRLSGDPRTYIRGANSTYYYIPRPALLKDYGMGSKFKKIDVISKSRISDLNFKGNLPSYARFEGNEVYAVANAKITHFSSREMIEVNYGLDLNKAAQLPTELKQYYKSNGTVQAILKLNDGSNVYSMETGKRRHIVGPTAFETLGGATVYSKRPSSTLSTEFANGLSAGAPIILSDKVLRANDTGEYYYWHNNRLYSLTPSVSHKLDPNYTTSKSSITQLPNLTTTAKHLIKSSTKHYYFYGGSAFEITASKANSMSTDTGVAVVTLPDQLFTRFKSKNTNARFIRFDDNATVYYNDVYKLGAIPNRSNFFGLGAKSFSEVISLPSSRKSAFYSNEGYRFAKNNLFKLNSTGERAYITDSQFNAFHIPNPDIAKQFSISLRNMIQLKSETDTSQYNIKTLSRFVKSYDGTKNWLVDNKTKYTLSSADLVHIGLASTDIVAAQDTADRLSKEKAFNRFARDDTTGKVYMFENGKKRWITSRAKANELTDWSKIISYSTGFMKSIPDGTKITNN